MCARQEIQGVCRPVLLRINLRQQIEGPRGIGLKSQGAVQDEYGPGILGVPQIDPAEVVQDLEAVGLQGIGLLELGLSGTMLFFRGEQNAQGEMDLQVVFVQGGKLLGGPQGLPRAAGLEVSSG